MQIQHVKMYGMIPIMGLRGNFALNSLDITGWQDCSVAKTTCCSCKGTEFNS